MSNFQYTILPSASQLGELPLYLAFQGVKSDNLGLSIVGIAFGFIATPISIAFTPIAISTDVVIGIAEAVFITYKGADRKDIQELLFKKIIVSPVQQIVCVITKTAIFVICPVLWTLSYAGSQGIIIVLPDSLNHKRMNIFINEGITDKNSTKTCFDEEPKTSAGNGQSNSQTPLEARIADVIANVSRINNAHTSQQYFEFKQKILNQDSAQGILGFDDNSFTKADLSKKYKALVLIVHPDKNLDCQEEARLLFCCLQEAFLELEKLVAQEEESDPQAEPPIPLL